MNGNINKPIGIAIAINCHCGSGLGGYAFATPIKTPARKATMLKNFERDSQFISSCAVIASGSKRHNVDVHRVAANSIDFKSRATRDSGATFCYVAF